MASFVPQTQTKKIWLPISKREHREARSRTSNTKYSFKLNRRKYDYRPEGPFSGLDRRRHISFKNVKYVSDQEAHWRRRPRQGEYSRPNEWSERKRAAKLRTLGTGIMATGQTIKYLGYAGTLYSAYQVAKNPKSSLDILLSFYPTYGLNPRSVKETQTAVTTSATSSYLSRYARALKRQ